MNNPRPEAFEPPRLAGVSTLASVAFLFVASVAAAQEPADRPTNEIRFNEAVEVYQIVVDMRVVDDKGQPILGLTPGDLALSIDGEGVKLDSVKWISGETPYAEGLNPEQAAQYGLPAAPPGRLLVLFFQKDMSEGRLGGLLKMVQRAGQLVNSLTPNDRTAVVSFDTRLHVWTDFTGDKEQLRAIVERKVLKERPPALEALASVDGPSLLLGLDFGAARQATGVEAALAVVARGLQPLPGTKSLALVGYGMGRMVGGDVEASRQYNEARRALAAADVTVFSLDVTQADEHTLQVGLESVAEDTGGFYAKTHEFDGAAMKQIQGALAGHYTVSFAKPKRPRGRHTIQIQLVGRKGNVLAPNAYEG